MVQNNGISWFDFFVNKLLFTENFQQFMFYKITFLFETNKGPDIKRKKVVIYVNICIKCTLHFTYVLSQISLSITTLMYVVEIQEQFFS